MTSASGTPTDPAAAGAAPEPPQQPGPPPRIRASDADRAVVIGRLQDAMGHGLLSFEETDERIAAAHAARFLDELPALSSDLPAPQPAVPTAMGWRRLGESLVAQLRYEVQTTASSSPRSRRVLLSVVALVVLLGLFVAMVSAATHGIDGPGHFHGPGDFGPGDFGPHH